MKKFYISFLILFGCCICFFCSPALAYSWARSNSDRNICSQITPTIKITIFSPKVQYTTNLSAKQFTQKYNEPECTRYENVNMCIRGLTVPPKLYGQLKVQTHNIRKGNKFFSCIKNINLQVAFKDPIRVYVTNQYPQGTCQHQVIYDHENYHVKVFYQSIDFFKPQIAQFFKNEAQNLPPIIISGPEEVLSATQEFISKLMADFQPVQAHINQKILEKNNAIDTPQAYEQQSRLCPNW